MTFWRCLKALPAMFSRMKSQFISETTDVVTRKCEQRPWFMLKLVCDHLVENQLRLLVSDKAALFVVPNDIFSVKASTVLPKVSKQNYYRTGSSGCYENKLQGQRLLKRPTWMSSLQWKCTSQAFLSVRLCPSATCGST